MKHIKLFEEMTDRSDFDLSLDFEDLTLEEQKRWAMHIKKERPGDYQLKSPEDWWDSFKHIDKK